MIRLIAAVCLVVYTLATGESSSSNFTLVCRDEPHLPAHEISFHGSESQPLDHAAA